MSSEVTLSQNDLKSESRPQSTTDSAIGGSTSPDESSSASKANDPNADSSFSADEREEENFESYGENEDSNLDFEAEMPDFDDVDSPNRASATHPNPGNFVRRNAWMRSSLRRSPAAQTNQDQLVPPRRWGSFRHSTKRVTGSNALASALYYNNGVSSFNSSGRSSNCDEGDMQSDISLEEDVNDLNQKVQMLEKQVGHLAESQASTDDRYSKVKQENVALNQKVLMLEEHIQQIEVQAQEKVGDEQRRNRELMQRLEREKALELENYAIKLQSAEREGASNQRDLTALRSQVDRLKTEKGQLEQELLEAQQSYSILQKECQGLEDSFKRTQEQLEYERSDNSRLVEELSKEVDDLRSQLSVRRNNSEDVIITSNPESGTLHPELVLHPDTSRVRELESELKSLRDESRKLKEEKEDLQAQVINGGVNAGRMVLQNAASISIADELGSLSDNQEFPNVPTAEEYKEVRNALKEQQEVNASLRDYIDRILNNIILQHPELLEVGKN